MTLLNPYQYIDTDFDMRKIKILHIPTDYTQMPKVTVSFKSLQDNLPPQEFEARAFEWQTACQKEPLENEPLVSVRFINLESGDLNVAPTQYKDWKTMAKKGFYNKFGAMYIPNALNVQILPKTTDDYLVLGDRPAKKIGKLPSYQIPGGMLNQADQRAGKIAPDLSAVRELTEEVGNVPIQKVSYLGASFYAGRVLTTLYYVAELSMTAKELSSWREQNKDHIRDFDAFPKEHFVPLTQKGIKTALDSGRLRETAQVGLLLKGKKAFGNEWFIKNCPKKIRG